MDPEANLKELRELAEQLADTENIESTQDLEDLEVNARRMAELFQALDGWITKGGFLPSDWKRS